MSRPPATTDGALERAIDAARVASDLNELKAAQAVMLPLLGMSLEDTARVVGKTRFWVSRARTAFLRGEAPPKEHGGRRQSLVSEDEEVELLKLAIARHTLGFYVGAPVRRALHDLLLERGHENVSESTLTSMLHRAFAKMFPRGDFGDLQPLAAALNHKWRIEEKLESVSACYCTRPSMSATRPR